MTLPAGWRMVRLEDVAHSPRAIVDGPFGSNLARQHYTDSGPRVVRLQNIGEGQFLEAEAHISREHFESLRKHEVIAGDLLVASLGEPVLRACLAPPSLGDAIVKADCIRVRLDDSVDSKFVLYSLENQPTKNWAAAHSHGVGRMRLGLKVIRALPIALPPLDDQRRIVEILEEHLSRLDAAERLMVRSDDRVPILRSVASQALVDHFPRQPLRSLVCRIEAGRSFGGSAAPAALDEFGVIKVSAMTWGRFLPEQNKRVPADRADARYEIHRGDVLVSRANTTEYVGASVHVDDVRPGLLLSDKSLRLVPYEGVENRWLHFLLTLPQTRRQMSARATGTKDSMRNLSQENLLAVQVPDVQIDARGEVLGRVNEISSVVERNRDALRMARSRRAALRRALLQAAFSGQLTGHSSDLDRAEELVS